jgi:hypothetical protein
VAGAELATEQRLRAAVPAEGGADLRGNEPTDGQAIGARLTPLQIVSDMSTNKRADLTSGPIRNAIERDVNTDTDALNGVPPLIVRLSRFFELCLLFTLILDL